MTSRTRGPLFVVLVFVRETASFKLLEPLVHHRTLTRFIPSPHTSPFPQFPSPANPLLAVARESDRDHVVN